jgi:hypothetical protein
MEHMKEADLEGMTKPASRRRFFVYAPPLKGSRPSRRKPPQKPFKEAKAWQTSVYYYWWEYLRRHEGYRRTCDNGGKGKYAALYKDFGDVHSGEFWDWWTARQDLFCEPTPPFARIVVLNDVCDPPPNTLFIQVSLEQRLALTIRQIKRQLKDMVLVRKRDKTPSRARYPVYTKPVLSKLHTCLMTWDAKQENPGWNNYLIHDYVTGRRSRDEIELFQNTDDQRVKERISEKKYRQPKTYAVSRDLRIAQQYIDNVALGEFPKRSGR